MAVAQIGLGQTFGLPGVATANSNVLSVEYTTLTGFFLQDEASTDPLGFDYATTNFGLINRPYPTDDTLADAANKTQWERFAHHVDTLNVHAAAAADAIAADGRAQYKVLIMGRHGEGVHNAAETYYGTPAWDAYWSKLDGNGTVVWKDARLTAAGEAEARKANRFWADQLAIQKQPAPQRYYTSPLTRCLQTSSLTFGGLALPAAQPFVPTVKERLRESISTHTCDHRSRKSEIAAAFPNVLFEAGFTEEDELWTGTTDETPAAEDVRSKALLDDIFAHDDHTWLSFTSHSGEIASLLRVLGHRVFPLSTGQIIPVLVRARTLHLDNGTETPAFSSS
ncbi:Histidine phosphatase superfamily, clade-1 [Niveomyces insectorum RCEF 264]|uniref:Histidine phosphatase superfamily, clade-1 n=1 Tax=Niveomyces insectorum RCEF 264 TaxID=1081102 RepID=A0A167XYH3_9HYPO|nr:Histidine phosphatase superfamily, clade-1 [Niveomyces insectorum RCEF 264]